MTVQDLIALAGEHPRALLAVFFGIPLASWITGRLHRPGAGGESPWRFFYAVLVFAACVPGICTAVLGAYTLFFLRGSLLEVNLLVYFAPFVSMVVTLAVIARQVSLDEVPGFDRLSGLMAVIAVTFALVLGIERTRIWVLFGGSLGHLLLLVMGLFALLHWGTLRIFRGRRDAGSP